MRGPRGSDPDIGPQPILRPDGRHDRLRCQCEACFDYRCQISDDARPQA